MHGLIDRKSFADGFVEGLSQGAQWGMAGGIGTYALTTTLTLTAVIGGVMGGTGGNVKGWVNGSKQWDWNAAWKGAAIGAVTTAAAITTGGLVTSGMTSAFGAGATGATSIGASVSGGLGGGFTGGFIGGAGMAWANGANFDQAMTAGLKAGISGAVSGAIGGAFGLGKISPFRMALRPNEKRDALCQTRTCLFSDGDPSVGPRTGIEGTGDDNWFTKGVARFFPGGDSMSNMHDDMLDYLTEGSSLEGQLGTQMPDALNYGTMLPAFGFTAYDLSLSLAENYGYMWH